MHDYVIFVDTSADIDPAYAAANDIRFVPMHYTLGSEDRCCSHMEDDDLLKRFYDGQRKGDLTQTSQITPNVYLDLFAPILAEGRPVIYLSLSSGLTKTFDNVLVAKQELDEEYPAAKLYPVDSLQATGGIALLAEKAVENRAAGMSAADIRANYDALIDYNLLWHRGSLVFPTLPMSAGGAIHFQEVKRIFDGIWIACIVSGILSLFLLIRQHRLGRRKHFTIAGILAIVIPAILGILVAIDWERFFVTFHKLAFRNDFWLFDPATDPVILILPDTYFLQCAVGILAIILIGAVVFLLLGRRRK